MDFPVKMDSDCSCGRGKAPATGFCDACCKEAADAFWAFIDARITFAGFIRRLRKGKKS